MSNSDLIDSFNDIFNGEEDIKGKNININSKTFNLTYYDDERNIIFFDMELEGGCIAKKNNYYLICSYSPILTMQKYDGEYIHQNLDMLCKAVEDTRSHIIN